MKKDLAIVFEGNINNRLGVFNAVVNRAKHLMDIADYNIDVFMIQVYDGHIVSRLRHTGRPAARPTTVTADGVTINVRWFKRSLTDSICHRILHRQPSHLLHFLRHDMAAELKDYDIVSAHDRMAGHVAEACHNRFGTPFFITWHGASIYTDPPRDAMLKALTAHLLETATCNFFVSEGLASMAADITRQPIRQDVLLNGASSQFHRYTQQQRAALRQQFGVPSSSKVVAFVGRFEPVKNPDLLPTIFSRIQQLYEQPVTFWTIGDGYMLPQVKTAMRHAKVECRFWGLQPPDDMPRFMNCIDVLILPSSLEGLPLVTIEALSCGANVVATDVVGTAEAIGKENAFTLDANFPDKAAHRATEMLTRDVGQHLPPEVSWTATAAKENAIYEHWLNKSNL